MTKLQFILMLSYHVSNLIIYVLGFLCFFFKRIFMLYKHAWDMLLAFSTS